MANKKQKMTAKQLKEREERALERQRKAQEKAARKALLWRIFVIAVCVILILALSLPTMGLMFLGGNYHCYVAVSFDHWMMSVVAGFVSLLIEG